MASKARHSKEYVSKNLHGSKTIIVSPTRNILIAGLLAATIIPTAAVSNVYADNQSRLSGYASNVKDAAVINAYTDGTVVASRSFTPASDTSTSEVSRSESRSIIEKGTWGGIEDINIVQTKSADQNDATKKLQDAINNAQSVLDSSNGKANDNDRKSLQDIINESNGMTNDVYLTVDALNNQTSKVNDAVKKVSDEVNAYNASVAARTRTARNTGNSAAGAGNASKHTGNPVKQGNYDEWVASHPDSPMGEKVLEYAKQFNGYPYVWAAAGPDAFDCSGLVMYVYAHFGVQLAHYSGYQMNAGTGVSDINHATYGDIIASSSHAALFAGFDSDGEPIVFNALNPQAGVTYTKLKYAFPNGYAIRRIFN